MSTTTLIALLATAVLGQHVVVVPLDALAPADDEVDALPVELLVDRFEAHVYPDDETGLEFSWTLTALEPTWVDLALVGNDLALTTATLDGHPIALPPDPDGRRRLTAELRGRHEVRVSGTIETLTRRLDLPVLDASRGTVWFHGEGWDAEVDRALQADHGRFDLPPVDRLTLSWTPATPQGARPVVVSAEVATALSIDEVGLEGHALLRYRIRHGEVATLQFTLPGDVESLEVEGPAVRAFRRSGDRVSVELTRPLRGAASLDVRFRAPAPEGDAARSAPLPTAGEGAGWLTVLRGDEALVVPEPAGSLEPVASRALPSWARGLADGETVATYRAGRAPELAIRVLRYDPVEAPPTLIDEARYEVAHAEHGRLLLRARYQVRNDRNQYLHVVPPAGFQLLGALVTGVAVQPVSDGDGGVYVPLEKSIETLHGLVAFPVEVLFFGDEVGWSRRGTRTLVTPSVDAPVAYARWEVVLPAGFEGEGIGGGATEVEHWTDRAAGLTYGMAHGVTRGVAYAVEIEEDEEFAEPDDEDRWVMPRSAGPALTPRPRKKARPARGGFGFPKGEPAPPPPEDESARDILVDERRLREDRSQDAWNQAYNAYKLNAFDEAQGYLLESLEHDPSNPQAQALLSNVSVLLGEDEDEDDAPQGSTSSGGEVMVRRVKEMARARTGSTQVKQDKLKKKAEEAYRAGDMEAAARDFQALVEVTEELAQVEQAESFDQKLALHEYERQLAEVEQRVDELDEKEQRAKARLLLLEESVISGVMFDTNGDGDTSRGGIVSSPDSARVFHEPVTEFEFESAPAGAEAGVDRLSEFDFESTSVEGELLAPRYAPGWEAPADPAPAVDDLLADLPPDAHVQYDWPVEQGRQTIVLTDGEAIVGDDFEDLDGIDLDPGEMAIVFGPPAPTPPPGPPPRPASTTSRRGERGHRGGGGILHGSGKAGSTRVPAVAAPPPRERDRDRRSSRETTDSSRQNLDRGDQTIRVTAATLSTEVPRAGTSLLFEQRLVPENEPLTAELRFRSTARRNR